MFRKQSSEFSRRRFLKTAGATALAASAPAVIIPGRAQPKTLKILAWKDFIASVNQWDADFARSWGEQNNIQVIRDEVSMDTNPRQTETELAAGQGHDLYYYVGGSPAVFEAQLIDHRDIYQECERRYGKVADFAVKSSLNPKTNRFFGFWDSFGAAPVIYRKDLWDGAGRAPDSWDDVRLGGRQIKFMQGPYIGISLGSDVDAEFSWRALLYSFGGSEQDADNRPALKSAATLEDSGTGIFWVRPAPRESVRATMMPLSMPSSRNA
jgi:multiple sugar transport system substrate-binding protein